MCLTGIESVSPGSQRGVNGVSRVLDHVDLAADEPQDNVRQQRAGQQPRLAQDLEAVADPEHRAALAAKRDTASITGAKRAIAPARR